MKIYRIKSDNIITIVSREGVGQYGYRFMDRLARINSGGKLTGRLLWISGGFAWHGNTGGYTEDSTIVPADLESQVIEMAKKNQWIDAYDMMLRDYPICVRVI